VLGDISHLAPGLPWTRGIPLLHPWANRIDASIVSDDVRLDDNGLPIHGLLSAHTGWHEGTKDFVGLEVFPYDHTLRIDQELDGNRLTITTALTAHDTPVPIAFGYHPYFTVPAPRSEWRIELPVDEHLTLDDRLLPTGQRTPAGDLDGPLGERTFDDLYTLRDGVFALTGGGLRIELRCEHGYAYAQVFAPKIADVICFEPMTAPAVSPGTVAPGETFSARFSVSVSPAA